MAGLQEYTRAIPAGSSSNITAIGTFIRVSQSPSRVKIIARQNQIGDKGGESYEIRMKRFEKWKNAAGFDSVEIYNETAATITVVLLIGFGDYEAEIISRTQAAATVETYTKLVPQQVFNTEYHQFLNLLPENPLRKGFRYKAYGVSTSDGTFGFQHARLFFNNPGTIKFQLQAASTAWGAGTSSLAYHSSMSPPTFASANAFPNTLVIRKPTIQVSQFYWNAARTRLHMEVLNAASTDNLFTEIWLSDHLGVWHRFGYEELTLKTLAATNIYEWAVGTYPIGSAPASGSSWYHHVCFVIEGAWDEQAGMPLVNSLQYVTAGTVVVNSYGYAPWSPLIETTAQVDLAVFARGAMTDFMGIEIMEEIYDAA